MENFDQLFQLIHSLSKAEKRHFKIYTSLKGGDKMYMELFDLIEKQKQYDEKKLKSKLKVAAFAAAKVYLYNLILKSLRIQNHSSKKKQVNDLIENSENLLAKGLYDQSYKQLMKAKKIAQEYQLFSLLIEIHSMNYAITAASQSANLRAELYKEGNKELMQIMSALIEQFEYRRGINFLVYKIDQRGEVVRILKEKEDIENETAGLLKKDPEKCLSFKGKNLHYCLSGLYYKSYNQVEKACNQFKKSMEHLSSDKNMLSQEITNYISSANNIINCLALLGKNGEIMSFIKKIKELPVESDSDKDRIFAFATSREIMHYTNTRQYQQGNRYITELKEQILIYENKSDYPSYYTLCSGVQEFYFVFGDFKQALQWNNRVLNHPEIKLYYHFYYDARVSEIIIHYELGNEDTFQSLVKSHELFLKKNINTSKFENTFLSFFKQLVKITEPQKRKPVFTHFLDQLRELEADSQETEVFDNFDLKGWLKCKIGGSKFS
jgi:hypothetical protein